MDLTKEDIELAIIKEEEKLNKRMEKGCDDRGMVAWEMHLWTPDAPHGRKVPVLFLPCFIFILANLQIVLISNDITFQTGTFAMKEHSLYQKVSEGHNRIKYFVNFFWQASEYSRTNALPRVYVSANSGARIGFASDVKNRLKILWNDNDETEEGFKYLVLECREEQRGILSQVEINDNFRIFAVLGKENEDIGVENLVGSGMIAGETSAAYQQVPTYCLVIFIFLRFS